MADEKSEVTMHHEVDFGALGDHELEILERLAEKTATRSREDSRKARAPRDERQNLREATAEAGR